MSSWLKWTLKLKHWKDWLVQKCSKIIGDHQRLILPPAPCPTSLHPYFFLLLLTVNLHLIILHKFPFPPKIPKKGILSPFSVLYSRISEDLKSGSRLWLNAQKLISIHELCYLDISSGGGSSHNLKWPGCVQSSTFSFLFSLTSTAFWDFCTPDWFAQTSGNSD